ncbi:acyltransferase family protein [Tranquillimonas alkanivorans]|uniref:Peptidoglycan/LPS O-acetylase OafA/YrhL, contains acyltransferase and SGNH-hydrolase domains n=1 Tax=Tranquillimonas alkanivorans TaxID=441119 RepID=A0A1I5VRM9_9RHOB|nr:acyltransferase [Tranquillimonas alkanivorans]SFQ09656.1 Peptidoglycan/LPS O-acetylase OafA/YrhL, contains acyltransferase and SGNH-hydrolase domains [Tranquillimonas alkanivorans]
MTSPSRGPFASAASGPLKVANRASAERLDALQAARAVAAILVVFYHANDFVLPLRLYDGEIAWKGFGWGYAGVEFFFVLSGFIIAYVHREDLGRPARVARFLRKRVIRIYPIYWVVLTFLLLGYQFVPDLAPEAARDGYSILTSYLLAPAEGRTVLPVAWTLKHEILFYITFVTLIVDLRLGAAVFALWMAACALHLADPPESFPSAFFLSPYNLLFMLGLAAAYLYRHLPARSVGCLLLLGIAGFLAVGFSEQYVSPWPLGLRTLTYGFSAAAIVASLARARYSVLRLGVFLGDASYAIYLLHLPVMNAAAILIALTGMQALVPPLLMFALLSCVAVFAGAVAHLVIERPLLAYLSPRHRSAIPQLGRG